jgi:two-component system, LuxR family, response regulator FixJ
MMIAGRSKVYIIDDDESVRRSLQRLLRCADYEVEAVATSEAYLALPAPGRSACLVVDMRMPGMSGLDLHRIIAGTSHDRPVVFVTGHGDEALRREAMSRGAVDVLFKPLDGDVLLEAIARALRTMAVAANS